MAELHLSELHKTLGALFNPAITPEWQAGQLALFAQRCDYLVGAPGERPYPGGDSFDVSDACLITIPGWSGLFGIDTGYWPALTRYSTRIAARPAVRAAQRAEGLAAD